MPVEEVDPGAGRSSAGLAVLRGQAGARARVGEQADRRGRCATAISEVIMNQSRVRDGEPGGVVDLPQVGDRHQDREEDQRRRRPASAAGRRCRRLCPGWWSASRRPGCGRPSRAARRARDRRGSGPRTGPWVCGNGSLAGAWSAGTRQTRTTDTLRGGRQRTAKRARESAVRSTALRHPRRRAAAMMPGQSGSGNRPRTYSGRDRHAGAPRAECSRRTGARLLSS